jgi:AAA family ATP:ADP antiporter
MNLLTRLTGVREEEARTALLSALYFFFVLSGYYILRPLREEMGLAGGVRNLPWLYLGTLAGTLLATPLFGLLVSRYPRRTFIPVTYRFFMVNLLLFFGALKFMPENADVYIGRTFYIWLSVFNMFAVSIFWAFMADVWGLGQSKRLFGFIAIGGSLGAIVGAAITANLVNVVGRVNLLLFSVVLLEIAVQCVRLLSSHTAQQREQWTPEGVDARPLREGQDHRGPTDDPDKATGGNFLAGISLTLRSPYLLAIGLYLFFYSISSTFLYFEQANIIDAAVEGREARAALFANIDMWVNILTVLGQLFITGRIIKVLGIGKTLLILPALTFIGFLGLGIAPILPVLVVFQVLRRAGNYAVVKPARETLYTIVTRQEKYKAKSFIDTFIYRGSDALGAAIFDGMIRFGMGLAAIAFTAVPVAAVWGGVGLYLGAKQQRLAKERESQSAQSAEPATQIA